MNFSSGMYIRTLDPSLLADDEKSMPLILFTVAWSTICDHKNCALVRRNFIHRKKSSVRPPRHVTLGSLSAAERAHCFLSRGATRGPDYLRIARLKAALSNASIYLHIGGRQWVFF